MTRQAKFVEMRAPALCHTLACLKSSQTVETQSGCWCTSKITELFLIDFPGSCNSIIASAPVVHEEARCWVKSLK